MTEVRCPDCGRLLARIVKPVKGVELFCGRCKQRWAYTSTGEWERIYRVERQAFEVLIAAFSTGF
jgi:phage FluMu protein Com